jgi:hypothetical protein
MEEEASLAGERFSLLSWALNERLRRLLAATEAKVLGRGGVTQIARVTGVSRRAIHVGLSELARKDEFTKEDKDKDDFVQQAHVRKEGGGRKKLTEKDPKLQEDLEQLIESTTRGDPESPLRWTCKSLRTLAQELKVLGHKVSYPVVGRLLHELDYSLQGNAKTLEGSQHIDRNAQFEWINRQVQETMKADNPVISVDAKKKELVGLYKNQGKTWRRKGSPEEVKVYDFVDKDLGRVTPYGVYDLADNSGWVSVGTDHDTASFAVETIRRWWKMMGKQRYAKARELMITADGGGSNGSRLRLWKMELQNLANELGIPIRVSHFPPGTSKWNKIEHRLFSFISMNWRGKPLVSHEIIVHLIAGTTNKSGIKVQAQLDKTSYQKGIKISKKDFASINIKREEFHGDWNYVIRPNLA